MGPVGRLTLLILVVLGCRSQRPLGAAPAEAGAAEEAAPVAPDVPLPAPDVLLPSDVAALPPDAPLRRDLGADRPPPIDLGPAAKCEQPVTYTACTESGDGRTYLRRRDGRGCGLCKVDRDAALGSVTHCLVGDDPDDVMVYCARSCLDCCYTVRGAPCQINDDCCAPLKCTSVGALRICDQ